MIVEMKLTTIGDGVVKVAKMVTYASKYMRYVRHKYSNIKK